MLGPVLPEGVPPEPRRKAFVELDSGVIHPSIPLSKSASRAIIVGADVGTGLRVGLGVGAAVVGVIVGTVFKWGGRNVNRGGGTKAWRK